MIDNKRILVKVDEIMAHSEKHPIIFFDGDCFLCGGFVQDVVKRDKNQVFNFATLQEANKLNLFETRIESVVCLHNGSYFQKAKAILHILKLLGGKYALIAKLGTLIPLPVSDFLYDVIAKYRNLWFKNNLCEIKVKSFPLLKFV